MKKKSKKDKAQLPPLLCPSTTLPPLCWLLLQLLLLLCTLILTMWCARAVTRTRPLNTAKIVPRPFVPSARGLISNQRPFRTISSSRLMRKWNQEVVVLCQGSPVVTSILNKRSTLTARQTSKQSAPNVPLTSIKNTKSRDCLRWCKDSRMKSPNS